MGGHSEDLSFFPFAHENCLHFKVAPVINDKKKSKAPCCDRSSPCNTMNLRSSESSPQIAPLDETIKEMCVGGRCLVSWCQPTKQLKLPLQVMPDLFFYRDPEEVEREEAAKEAEVVAVMYYQYKIWK